MSRFDPHSYTDPAQGTISALDVDWRVDFDNRTLHGKVTLRFESPHGGLLDLDTRDLAIDSVHGALGDAEAAALPFDLAEPEGFLGAKLTIGRPSELDRITIGFRSSKTASALQWLEPANTASGQHPYLFSQCQPIHARSMLPLQDSPRVRFCYTARVTVPDPLVAVMSASPGDRQKAADLPNHSCYAFSMPQPIPAHLLALAVGQLVFRDLGPRTRVYAEPELIEAAAYEFAEVEKMLEAAEKLFGPYLWDRFDFLVMPPAFPYGGMENPRLTFLTPTLIAGDRSLVDVLAHELAHSWTGNLVTNATMNDFWINEGFTVWAERRILESLSGQSAVALSAALGRHQLDREIERFGADSPLTRLETDLSGVDPDEVYSVVPYEKGFLFVALLEKTLGREAFDGWVRGYLEHFKFTSITTSELEAYLQKTQPGLLEKIDANAWLHGPGIPENCPTFVSERLGEVQSLAAAFPKQCPDQQILDGFSAEEWQIFLQRIERPLAAEFCRWLDEGSKLSQSGNSEILCQWLTLAAESGYSPAHGRIREFLSSVGRMKYLKPLYKALDAKDESKALGKEIFEQAKGGYHPIARAVIAGLLH